MKAIALLIAAIAVLAGCGAGGGGALIVPPAATGITLSPPSSSAAPLPLTLGNDNQSITVNDPGYSGPITYQNINSDCFGVNQMSRVVFDVYAPFTLCKHNFYGSIVFSDGQGRSATAYFYGND